MTMAQAMKEANSAEPAKYLPFLKKIKYSSAIPQPFASQYVI
jgi:hypothetical protein